MECPNPKCKQEMLTTYRIEDEPERECILRRVVEFSECQNLKCGCTVEVVQTMKIEYGEPA